MSQLRFPLKDHLRDPADEAALHRIAQGIDSPSRPPRARRFLPFVLASGAAVGIGIAMFSHLRIHRDVGALTFADGREFVGVAAENTSSEVRLSDGSSVRLSPGTHLEPLESSGRTFSAIVTQGRADF